MPVPVPVRVAVMIAVVVCVCHSDCLRLAETSVFGAGLN